jgi:fructose PTS system EIIBC or EIIC component
MAKIVGVTSCPTGIAHSLMAAEALKKTAAIMGHDIRIEIHGAEGRRDSLSDEEIATADVVILAADIHVELERFGEKPIHEVSTSRAIRETEAVIDEALRRLPEENREGAGLPSEAAPIPE